MKTNCLVVLTACCVVLLSSRAPAADNPLLGDWYPATISDSGLGGVRSYEENGRVVLMYGAAVYLKYKVEKNAIVMETPGEPPVRMGFTVTDNTLTLDCGDGQ